MIKVDKIIGLAVIVALFYYAIIKERVDEGCEGNFKIFFEKKTCDNQNSLFLSGTKPEPNDDYNTTTTKMRSLFHSFDRDVYWRKSMIASLVISLFVFLVYKYNKEFNLWSFYIILLLSFAAIQFFQGYMYYHFYIPMKNNGLEMLDKLISFQKQTQTQ